MSKTTSPAPPAKTLVTMEALAANFGVSRSTVKNWRSRRIIEPCVSIGNIVRFDLAECERRLAALSRKTTVPRGGGSTTDNKDTDQTI